MSTDIYFLKPSSSFLVSAKPHFFPKCLPVDLAPPTILLIFFSDFFIPTRVHTKWLTVSECSGYIVLPPKFCFYIPLTTNTALVIFAIAKTWSTLSLCLVLVRQMSVRGSKKEQLFSFLGILRSEWRKSCAGHLDPACSNTSTLPLSRVPVLSRISL